MNTKDITTVDDYIDQAPPELHAKLKQIRALIKEVAPEAIEKISYHIPYYNYKGYFVYFGVNKAHIGVYAIVKDVFKQFADEVKPYMAAKGTIRIPFDEDIPVALLKKLLKAQKKYNDENNRNARD